MKKGSIDLKGKSEEFYQKLAEAASDPKKRLALASKFLQTKLGYSEQRAKAALKR
jgi:hypothetical protein